MRRCRMVRTVRGCVSVVVMTLALLVLPGCGSAATTVAATCNVFAAASLTKVFPEVQTAFKQANPQYANVEFVNNFQGTDTLVAQIKEGAPADVFASASLKFGKELLDAGLIEKPVNFCMNKVIVIVPAGNPGGITTLADLAVSGKKIAICAESVPAGNYTRAVLEKMNAGLGSDFTIKVMSNVVTEASKVTAVVSSVTLGEVDAGFVYVTDATSAGDKVERIDIPNEYQSDPLPTYPIAVVKTNKSGDIAQKFIDFLMSVEGQGILQKYDFLPVA